MPRTALITGGGSGLGKGFTESLIGKEYQVVILDYNNDNGLKTATELNARYGSGSVFYIHCDVSDAQQFKRAFDTAVKVYGTIDVFVNNAGIGSEEKIERIVDINLNAVIRGCQIAFEHMDVNNGGKGGSIINISSTAGLTAVPFEAIYSATKHGVVGLSRSLGIAYESSGVAVMCLCPSFTNTPLFASGPGVNPVIKSLGIMEVSDVVRAFDKLLEDRHPASVMAVTPKGIDYKFPKKLKTSRL